MAKLDLNKYSKLVEGADVQIGEVEYPVRRLSFREVAQLEFAQKKAANAMAEDGFASLDELITVIATVTGIPFEAIDHLPFLALHDLVSFFMEHQAKK